MQASPSCSKSLETKTNDAEVNDDLCALQVSKSVHLSLFLIHEVFKICASYWEVDESKLLETVENTA